MVWVRTCSGSTVCSHVRRSKDSLDLWYADVLLTEMYTFELRGTVRFSGYFPWSCCISDTPDAALSSVLQLWPDGDSLSELSSRQWSWISSWFIPDTRTTDIKSHTRIISGLINAIIVMSHLLHHHKQLPRYCKKGARSIWGKFYWPLGLCGTAMPCRSYFAVTKCHN